MNLIIVLKKRSLMVVKSRGAMNDGGSMTSIIPKILHSFLWALKNSFNPSHTKTKYRFIQYKFYAKLIFKADRKLQTKFNLKNTISQLWYSVHFTMKRSLVLTDLLGWLKKLPLPSNNFIHDRIC